MFSNYQNYGPNRKPLLGALLNPYPLINRGLVNCWLFNEGSGGQVFDLISHGKAGTLMANTHFASGKFGHALDFDGAVDYVEANYVTSGGFFGGTFTITAWAKLENWGANGAICGEQETGFANRYAQVYFDSATKRFRCETRIANINAVNSLSTYDNDDDWHFLAFVVNSSGHIIGLFVDDVYQGNDTTFDLNLATLDNFRIGQIPYTLPDIAPWNGKIDHVMIWERALAASEISLLYREPFCGFRWPVFEQLAEYADYSPEIRMLYMDLATRIWTVKHAKGLFTKL